MFRMENDLEGSSASKPSASSSVTPRPPKISTAVNDFFNFRYLLACELTTVFYVDALLLDDEIVEHPNMHLLLDGGLGG